MATISACEIHEDSKLNPSNDMDTEDQEYCDAVFESYNNHIIHIQELIDFIESKHSEFEEQSKETEQFFSLKKVTETIEVLAETIENLTDSFILKLENYFTKRYCLIFDSFLPARVKINQIPLSSYDSIRGNITVQVGKDLLKAGKEQIKNRFLKCFHLDRLPTLKGNKVTIPDFISLDEHYGAKLSLSRDYNSALGNLINALNLFLHDTTQLPECNRKQLLDWKTTIDLSQPYSVFRDVSFRFFKNRRIDVLFSHAITARKFWNYYKLEIIGKIILK